MADLHRQHNSQRIIRASELAEYGFCPRAWWLKHVQGVASGNAAAMERGITAHHRHGWLIIATQALRVGAALLLIGAIVLILLNVR